MKQNTLLFFKCQKYLLRYLDKSILLLVSSMISTVLTMAGPLVTKVLIDYAYPNKDVSLLIIFTLIGFSIFLVRIYFESIQDYLDMYIYQKISIRIKNEFYKKMQSLPLKFHNKTPVGDSLYTATNDIENVTAMITDSVPIMIQTFVQFLFLVFISLRFDWKLTLLALSGAPIYLVFTKFFAKKHQDVREEIREKDSEIVSTLQEKISAVKTIKIFGNEKMESLGFLKKLRSRFSLERRYRLVELFNTLTDSLVTTIWMNILIFYAGYHVIIGVLTIGEVVVMGSYLVMIYGPMVRMGGVYRFILDGLISARKIYSVLEKEIEIKDSADAIELKKMNGAIKFENISFGYSAGEYVLKDISLELSGGTKVAIVGSSGAGKTSLMELLARIYDPDRGRITIDGYDLRKIRLSCLRKYISIASQEPIIFKASIRENITYARPDAGMDEIINAAIMADAHDFINSFSCGYETMLDEKGVNLSSGQRQRISLARCFLRNPKILILDEATSVVDPESESYIYDIISKNASGKTIFSIAHRLSTVENADLIVVLEEGRIIEKGKFEELINKRGHFYKLYYEKYRQTV